MAIVIDVRDLMHKWPLPDEDMGDEFTDHPSVLHRKWGMILMMAVRDNATSIQYHPWRENDALAYFVDGIKHPFAPPPVELVGAFLAVARSLLTRPARPGLLARLRRRHGHDTACATVELVVDEYVFPWDVVVWSTGEHSGVELFREPTAVAP